MQGGNPLDARRVEAVERLVQAVHAPVAHAGQDGFDALAQGGVVLDEAVFDVCLTRHERAADE